MPFLTPRGQVWSQLNQPWDVLIIGGGITGAGILSLAARAGLRALLVEAADFSSGTSSRSSKLVHGGFRYLRNRQFNVTFESVREREWMLRSAPGLVTPLRFYLPNYARYHIPTRELDLGVFLYDLFAPKWQHRALGRAGLLAACPGMNPAGLLGGFEYYDAQVDDSRLVLRVIQEARAAGGTALNYTRAERLLRTRDGQVCGALIRDALSGESAEVLAGVVINAAGPWSDELRAQLGAPARLRKQRGSHLIFPHQRFPACSAVTLFHPRDRRALFVLPWEGVTMIGTTDLDHPAQLEARQAEPCASPQEVEYLLDAAAMLFPQLELGAGDVISSFAGLRPIIRNGAADPSKESRAHVVWNESGLITVTGGKLTTFRIMARAALQAAGVNLPAHPALFDPSPPAPAGADPAAWACLAGRYGSETGAVLQACPAAGELLADGLPTLRGEITHAARAGDVAHLDDLLLRRVRLGLLLPEGARALLPQIRALAQPALAWDDSRWQAEEARYLDIWQKYYAPLPQANA